MRLRLIINYTEVAAAKSGYWQCGTVLWRFDYPIQKSLSSTIYTKLDELTLYSYRICPAQKNLDYIGVNGFNPTLGHIAELRNNSRIKTTAGTGISEYSRLLAKDIVTYQDRIAVKEKNRR